MPMHADTTEFTPEDRERVRAVFLAALDELDDSDHLSGMFGPWADLVSIALHDPRITPEASGIPAL